MMKLRLLSLVLLVAVFGSFVAMPRSAAAKQGTVDLTGIPITQVLQGVGTFTGTLDIEGFEIVNGVLQAVGTVSGQLTSPTGAVLATLTDVPVTGLLDQAGSCRILELDLGPIDLDLLGLVLNVSPISIDLTAVAGPGNLLGNLLCAVAHLLDRNGGAGNAIDNLLGRINDLLGGLLG